MLILQKAIMKRNNALTLLRTIKPILAQQFGVTQLALFGSTARDEAGDKTTIRRCWRKLYASWKVLVMRRPMRNGGIMAIRPSRILFMSPRNTCRTNNWENCQKKSAVIVRC